jgi:hypothetical protein
MHAFRASSALAGLLLLAALDCAHAAGDAYGDMRAVIGPNAAVDAVTYEQYQRCLAGVPLNQDLNKVTAAREACKQKALASAYRVPSRPAPDKETGLRSIPSVKERTETQSRQLERLK